MARNTLVRHRNLFSRDPEEGGGGGTGGTGTEGGGGGSTDTGSGGGGGKENKTFTQEDLDRIVGERLNRQRTQFSDYDQLKADSAELARLKRENESDKEKAVREAREEAKAEERKTSAPRLVGAEFRAAAKGVITDAQRDAFLEDADLTKYLKEDGSVDTAKVEAKVKALAPEKSEDPPATTRTRAPRDTGAGNREGGAKPTVSSSREDYLERRRKQMGVTA